MSAVKTLGFILWKQADSIYEWIYHQAVYIYGSCGAFQAFQPMKGDLIAIHVLYEMLKY